MATTKPVEEEDSAAVGGFSGETGIAKRPEAELKQMAAAGPGAGIKVASGGDLILTDLSADARKAAAEANPVPPLFSGGSREEDEGGACERREPQIPGGPRPPRPPTCHPEEALLWAAESPEERDLWDSVAEMLEGNQALSDHETAILEQYRKYGYACEMSVVDDDDALFRGQRLGTLPLVSLTDTPTPRCVIQDLGAEVGIYASRATLPPMTRPPPYREISQCRDRNI
jgi:hypothetical protein